MQGEHYDRGVQETTEWLTVREAAAVLGLTKETVARMGHRGEIPIDRPGPRLSRIRRVDVESYIESCRIEPGTLGTQGPDAPTDEPVAFESASDRR
jgi:excisionase family DNA binding protein